MNKYFILFLFFTSCASMLPKTESPKINKSFEEVWKACKEAVKNKGYAINDKSKRLIVTEKEVVRAEQVIGTAEADRQTTIQISESKPFLITIQTIDSISSIGISNMGVGPREDNRRFEKEEKRILKIILDKLK